MIKPYELTILADESLTKDEALRRVNALLEGGTYTIEYGGCKSLAYPIGEHKKAHYIYVDAILSPLEVRLLPNKLEDLDWNLRYLLVTKQTRAERIKGIIREYINDTLGWEWLDKTDLDIEGLAYKIDSALKEKGE